MFHILQMGEILIWS